MRAGNSRRVAFCSDKHGFTMRYLDDGDSGFESGRQLVQDFGQKLLVLQDLPHLHDPHYGGLQTQTRQR